MGRNPYTIIMSRYVTILESEFDNLFTPEKNWKKDIMNNREIVYSKPLLTRPHILVKVYSSIRKDDGISRGVGQDAIRVCAINTKTDRGVRKTKRINRVPGWDIRLKDRVIEVWSDLVNEKLNK